MAWRSFFRKSPDPEPDSPAPSPEPAQRPIPPHLAQVIDKRSQGENAGPPADPRARKLAGLRRKRMAILFDIEQGELAASPENPWTNRMGLLTEAMTTVADDIAATSLVVPGSYHPVPALPIEIGEITAGDVATVAFAIGDNQFTYSEDPDWAERGHQLARTELVQRSGDVEALVPEGTPEHLRGALRDHLSDSLFVFASDLRDRTLDGANLPDNPTLADLAAPCPVCGGWTDWRGTCQTCARRNAEVMALKREEARLLDERSRESDERHRLVEGLPLARKRLRDVDAELAQMGEPVNT
jgi:hypothetical protein